MIRFTNSAGNGFSFEYYIEFFKTEYMRDEWSQRSLNFHLENLRYFKRFLNKQAFDIKKVTLNVLEKYVKEMRNSGKKRNTVNGRIKTLRVFFRILHAREYIPDNPATYLRLIKGPKTQIIPFSADQIINILAQPDKNSCIGLRDYMIMQILLDTGIRLGELCNIRTSDIDIKNCSLFVRRGKGNKSRTVGFGKETRRTLVKYYSCINIHDNEIHLISNQSGQPLHPRSIQDRITLYAQNAGIRSVRCSPHTFRHTFAKIFLMNDGDPYVLRDLLGHNSMSTVIIYLKLFREDLLKKYEGKSPVDTLWHPED